MEHWSNDFFKLARPKELESGGVTLATTSDSKRDLNDALEGRSRREREATFVYTQQGPGVVEQDGAIEHSEPIVKTDGPKQVDPAENLTDMLGPLLTPAQQAAQRQNYQAQLLAARALLPDFDETLDQADVRIPPTVEYMIKWGGLPNAPGVAYYLGKNRTECERLCKMTPKQQQEAIVKLSDRIEVDLAGMLVDKLPYRGYRKLRDSQKR